MKEELKKLIKFSKEQMKKHEWFFKNNKIELPMDYYINMGRRQICEYLLEKLEEPQEHKIPEKLNLDTDKLRGKEVVRSIDYLIEGKINEIIDYLEVNDDRN